MRVDLLPKLKRTLLRASSLLDAASRDRRLNPISASHLQLTARSALAQSERIGRHTGTGGLSRSSVLLDNSARELIAIMAACRLVRTEAARLYALQNISDICSITLNRTIMAYPKLLFASHAPREWVRDRRGGLFRRHDAGVELLIVRSPVSGNWIASIAGASILEAGSEADAQSGIERVAGNWFSLVLEEQSRTKAMLDETSDQSPLPSVLDAR